MEALAWLVLRIVYAWLFLYALKALLSNWQGAVGTVALVFPKAHAPWLAVLMVVVMFFAGLAILFGIYGHLAGFFLLVYNLIGALVHYRAAEAIGQLRLGENASAEDNDVLQNALAMGQVGHITSAQKNFVLAAMAFFFMIMGTGPASIH